MFFGRDEEIQEVTNLILAHRMSVLFGDSGVGKTSLVRAAVSPQLASEGYSISYMRVTSGEPEDLRRLLILSAGIAEQSSRGDSLDSYLLTHFGQRGRVVAFIDQAEELFTRFGRVTRNHWRRFLDDCRHVDSIDLRICMIIRADFLTELAELVNTDSDPDILNFRFKLWKLGPEQGRQCIARPAAAFDIDFTPALVNQMVEDLDDGGLDPSQLQILCSTLYNSAHDGEKPAVPITTEHYDRMGGASGILANYLEETLSSVEPGDQEIARAVLKSLVTNEATKDMRKLDQFPDEPLVRRTGADLERVRSVVNALHDRRLIRHVAAADAWELVHDVLVAPVLEWITEDEALLKSAQHAVRQGRLDWEGFQDTLSRGRWALINENANELSLTEADVIFLLQQAVLLDDHVAYWIWRASTEHIDILPTLIKAMQSGGYPAEESVLDALVASDSSGLFEAEKETLLAWCQKSGSIPASRWAARVAATGHRKSTHPANIRDKITNDLVLIPEGECTIGSDDSPTRDVFEGPRHVVLVDEFYMSRYPVTNSQYFEYVQDADAQAPENWANGMATSRQGEYPVVYVSWDDVRRFCEWLSAKSGLSLRMPTEAEWEKAASWSEKAGRAFEFGYGDIFDLRKCNTRESGIGQPTAVGLYTASGGDSPYGIADMTGNVWEWTLTRVVSPEGRLYRYPYVKNDGRNDLDDLSSPRVLRGGSCYNTQLNARCSSRFRINPHYRNGDIGFRVVADKI